MNRLRPTDAEKQVAYAGSALADRRSGPGDVVILSPASTSFDRFRNFEERGRTFKELVRELP